MPQPPKKPHHRVCRSLKVAGIWYDYQEPRRDFSMVPSIRMRGYWITLAGFAVGDVVDVEVAENSITLRRRKANPKAPK